MLGLWDSEEAAGRFALNHWVTNADSKEREAVAAWGLDAERDAAGVSLFFPFGHTLAYLIQPVPDVSLTGIPMSGPNWRPRRPKIPSPTALAADGMIEVVDLLFGVHAPTSPVA